MYLVKVFINMIPTKKMLIIQKTINNIRCVMNFSQKIKTVSRQVKNLRLQGFVVYLTKKYLKTTQFILSFLYQ